jgi:hypothetical protein
MWRRAAIFVLTMLSVRCATVVNGRGQRIHVTSSPAGATARITCDGQSRDAGHTPLDVIIPRKALTCSVTIAQQGFVTQTVTLTRVYSKKVWLDLIPGFVIGTAAGAAAAPPVIFEDQKHDSNNGNAAFAGGFAAGTGVSLLIDHSTGAWWTHVPGRIDVTLDPRP